MKEYKGYYWPDKDTCTADAVFYEWNAKIEKVLELVRGRDLVIQAGANVGVFPIRLSRLFKRVHTFEPIPMIWDCLQKNLELRGLENVSAHNCGLGERYGLVGINHSEVANCGATALGGVGDIPVQALDSLVVPCCDLLWFDIEGYEHKALLGSQETIAKYKPLIIIENKGLMPGFGGNLDGSEEFVAYMESLGYRRECRIMRDDFYVPNV